MLIGDQRHYLSCLITLKENLDSDVLHRHDSVPLTTSRAHQRASWATLRSSIWMLQAVPPAQLLRYEHNRVETSNAGLLLFQNIIISTTMIYTPAHTYLVTHISLIFCLSLTVDRQPVIPRCRSSSQQPWNGPTLPLSRAPSECSAGRFCKMISQSLEESWVSWSIAESPRPWICCSHYAGPTMKLRRGEVLKKYSGTIDGLYRPASKL